MKILELFNKNKSNVMSEVMADQKLKRYQWKKGDNFGKIVELQSTDAEFLYFTDGTRIFKNIQSEFLEEIKDGRVPLPGADKISSKLTSEILQTGPIQDQTNTVATNSSDAVIIQQPTVAKEPSVMGKMIMKMSKKNLVTIPIKINLNIPTPALHAMLSEGMEEQDLNDEIMEVALSQIEMDKLQDYIKSNITDYLREYYS